MRIRPILFVLAGIAVAACAGSGPRGERIQRNHITAAEIANVQATSAYELVQQLRPEFLRRRGQTSIRSPDADYPVVYLNGVRLGELNQLNTIPATTVEAITFIGAADATTRWGTGHKGGVIDVRTKT